jgi:predicted SAM-dependent methyltransferase
MRGVWKLKRLYCGLSSRLKLMTQGYPHRVQCNICGWKGRILSSDSWHPYTVCPRCRSQVRHRLLVAAVTTLANLGIKDLIQNKRVLHFAPEIILSQLIKDRAGKYVTADLCRNDVDMVLDMCNMSGVGDSSYDLVIACDVLEHVHDDSAALREICRVLSIHGWAILTVPQKDELPTKYEDPTITTPEGRKHAFGQEDHLRIYGDDFGWFLEHHGFAVTVVGERNFDSKLVELHVLVPPVLSVHPLATNHRKVYFAQKARA